MSAHAHLQDEYAELARLSEGGEGETWRGDDPAAEHPNPVVGELVKLAPGPDRGYGPTQIAEILDPTGHLWNVWLLGTILQAEFDQTRPGTPRPGDIVAVRYEGRRRKKHVSPTDKNPEYKAFRVVHRPRGASAQDLHSEMPFQPVGGHAAPEQAELSFQRPPAAEPQPGASAASAEGAVESEPCPACGMLNGFHKTGCPKDPDDIPF